MKKLILLAIVALFIAAPAQAQRTRQLLAATENMITVNGEGECIPFHYGGNSGFVDQGCSFQYFSWYPQRNATITEIQVVVVFDTNTQAGECGLVIETSLADELFDQAFAGPYYVDMSGSVNDVYDNGSAYVNRINVDLDVTSGTAYGIQFVEWTGHPSICWSGGASATIQVRLWGEYTE
jgi:hypothetical protein